MNIFERARKKITFIFSTTHRIRKVCDFITYSSVMNEFEEYCAIEDSRNSMVCPANYFGEQPKTAFMAAMPDSYCVRLKNASIIGASNVVLSLNGHLLYDMLSHRKIYHANITDNGLCMLGGVPMHAGEYFVYNYYRETKECIDKGISLASNMSGNYYHFMFEVASKLYYLSKLNIDKTIPLLVDEVVLKVPQMVEVLQVLNSEQRKILSVKPYVKYTVKQLIVFSKPHVIVPNLVKGALDRVENYVFDSNVLCWMRDRMLGTALSESKASPKRIFLTRKGLNKRSCNEQELEPVLKKYGFSFVDTGMLSAVEQACLFSNADVIVGSSGAAFTNLMYCKPGTKAVIFMPVKSSLSCFSSLASAMGVSTVYFSDNQLSHASIHQKHFSIDVNELDQYLANILK